MITRIAAKEVKELSESFKAIAIVGPRQSGKTTLAPPAPANKFASRPGIKNASHCEAIINLAEREVFEPSLQFCLFSMYYARVAGGASNFPP